MIQLRDAARAVAALLVLFGSSVAAAHAAHLRLDVRLDPEARALEGIAEFAAPGEITFPLHDSLLVRRVTADGATIPATVGGTGAIRDWRIRAPAGAWLRIEYGGRLPVLDTSLDHRAVLRQLAPMASASGTFLPAGSGWYPDPAGLNSYTVALSVPGTQRALVPGRLVDEKLPANASDRYHARFEFAHPAEGLALMAGPYVVRERRVPRNSGEPLRLRTYFFAELDRLADGYLDDSARYIDGYSRRIGAYPFEGFAIVASPLPTGFGLPGITYIGARVLKLPFIRTTSLGHEVLHNWWGNGVYVDYDRGNWSEGLTTFMADYAYRQAQSPADARDMRHAWLRDFAAVPEAARRPLTAFRARAHGTEAAVGYGKAAMLFMMLRDAIGADAFDRGIRAFWETQRFRIASWNDLRAAFEGASGKPLGTFFDQWVTRADAPRLNVSAATVTRTGGATALEIAIVQSAPPYALEVPLELVYGNRTEMRSVAIREQRQRVALPVDAIPRGVRLDPAFRLWRVLDPRELAPTLRQWIIAGQPRLIIAASTKTVRAAAQTVARSFFESPPVETTPAALRRRAPVLVIGLHAEVDALLAAHALPARPAHVRRGSAAAWTLERHSGRTPVAVVSARDAEALVAIARALPHYGAQSYVVFAGGQAIARGVWPTETPLVPVSR